MLLSLISHSTLPHVLGESQFENLWKLLLAMCPFLPVGEKYIHIFLSALYFKTHQQTHRHALTSTVDDSWIYRRNIQSTKAFNFSKLSNVSCRLVNKIFLQMLSEDVGCCAWRVLHTQINKNKILHYIQMVDILIWVLNLNSFWVKT